jgi:hypothetical protein
MQVSSSTLTAAIHLTLLLWRTVGSLQTNYAKKFPHWNEQDTRELALEGWEKVSQNFINNRINSMPQRIQDCIDLEGQMTAW